MRNIFCECSRTIRGAHSLGVQKILYGKRYPEEFGQGFGGSIANRPVGLLSFKQGGVVSDRDKGVEASLHFVSASERIFHQLGYGNFSVPDQSRDGIGREIKHIRGGLCGRAYDAVFDESIDGGTVVAKLGENDSRVFSEPGNASGGSNRLTVPDEPECRNLVPPEGRFDL